MSEQPINANFAGIDANKEGLDFASKQIKSILATVEQAAQDLKANWDGETMREYERQQALWQEGASDMDAAFTTSIDTLGEMNINMRRTERNILGMY